MERANQYLVPRRPGGVVKISERSTHIDILRFQLRTRPPVGEEGEEVGHAYGAFAINIGRDGSCPVPAFGQ